jgi:hypothetical protein
MVVIGLDVSINVHKIPMIQGYTIPTTQLSTTTTTVQRIQSNHYNNYCYPSHHHHHHHHRAPRVISYLQMSTGSTSTNSALPSPPLLSQPKGSAAKPYQKQKIITMGNGGYMGGILFGYLQRASSIYSTGIGNNIRSIAATADASVRLNRILNQHFVLAQADESYIKLTNLLCIDAIQQRMNGYDAIIIGTDLYLERKKVVANTYETTPNDFAYVGVNKLFLFFI